MNTFKEYYAKALDSIGEMPSFKDDWRWVAIYSICIYAIVLAFRMSFAGRWDHPELWVNGERILATHDAYFWLAKAKGVGRLFGYPLAQLAGLLQKVTGVSLGTIGFWAPAVLGALVGVACYLWGWLLGGRYAGIFAGLVGALTPGFFYRSRLGYFDTDLFTLLGPLMIAWMLAYLLSQWMKPGWFISSAGKEQNEKWDPMPSLVMAFAFGLATRFFCMWHNDIVNLSIWYFFLATGMLLVNARPERRIFGFYGLLIFLLASLPGASFLNLGQFFLIPHLPYALELTYITLSLLLMVLLVSQRSIATTIVTNKFLCAGIFLLGLWASDIVPMSTAGIVQKFWQYFQQSVTTPLVETVGAPVFPSTIQSIIETALAPLADVLTRSAFFPWLGWLALIVSICVLLVRPAALFLFPLIMLSLLSVKLGVRFSMFGGAALMILLSVGTYLITSKIFNGKTYARYLSVVVQSVLGMSLLIFSYTQYSKIPLTPVLTKQHAEALVELAAKAPADGTVWTWWDWGYASQYYAGLGTTIDGGLHTGMEVYPTALAMSTNSPLQANQIIRETAQYKRRFGRGYDIGSQWAKKTATDVMSSIELMKSVESNFPLVPPQYLVVTWKDMTIAKWITFFGNWNLESGTTKQATISNFQPGELGFNIQRGAIRSREGRGGLVRDITTLSPEGVDAKEYYLNRLSPQLLPKGQHLLINSISRQSALLDRVAYRSMMRRLLTGDPTDPEISKYFKLVVDKLPFARIYEVVQ